MGLLFQKRCGGKSSKQAWGDRALKLVATADWLTRQVVENRTLVLILQATLDAGEAEVIGLAQEIQADLTYDHILGKLVNMVRHSE